jgi:hypothetical protein
MTDEHHRGAGRAAVEEPEWRTLLREAMDEVLIDVRILHADEEEGFDFLLVHPKGDRGAAIDRFLAAMLKATDIPPHVIISADQERATRPEFRDYVSIRP